MKQETVGHYTYHDAIREQAGLPLETDEQIKQKEQKTEDQVIKRTMQVQWLQDTTTKEMFRALQTEILNLESRASQLAVTYHEHNNHMEIINLLVRAAELKKIKLTYGS